MKIKKMLPMAVLCVIGLAMVVSGGCKKNEPAAISGPAEVGAAVQFANTKCPIMGNPIDPENVTADLTREFNGQKVAFCCAACPGKWDALSDGDKAAKLAAAK